MSVVGNCGAVGTLPGHVQRGRCDSAWSRPPVGWVLCFALAVHRGSHHSRVCQNHRSESDRHRTSLKGLKLACGSSGTGCPERRLAFVRLLPPEPGCADSMCRVFGSTPVCQLCCEPSVAVLQRSGDHVLAIAECMLFCRQCVIFIVQRSHMLAILSRPAWQSQTGHKRYNCRGIHMMSNSGKFRCREANMYNGSRGCTPVCQLCWRSTIAVLKKPQDSNSPLTNLYHHIPNA